MATKNNVMWSMIPTSVRYEDPNSPGSVIIKQNRGLNHPIIYHGPIDGNGTATLLVGNRPDIHPYGFDEEFYLTGKFSNGEFVDELCIICTIDVNDYGFFFKNEKIIGKIVNGKFVKTTFLVDGTSI